jgi:truncated hemoglobin YjbI
MGTNYVDDRELLKFTEDWWAGFMTYEEENGRACAQHVFKHVHKQHFVDFPRDGLAELGEFS